MSKAPSERAEATTLGPKKRGVIGAAVSSDDRDLGALIKPNEKLDGRSRNSQTAQRKALEHLLGAIVTFAHVDGRDVHIVAIVQRVISSQAEGEERLVHVPTTMRKLHGMTETETLPHIGDASDENASEGAIQDVKQRNGAHFVDVHIARLFGDETHEP